MRIGIDARFLTHPQKGGFKTYTENLITSISEIDQDNEYILYLDHQPLHKGFLIDQPNFTFKVISGDHAGYGMFWREQYTLPRQIKKDELDIFHAPCLTSPLLLEVPLVVTIHDMIWYYPNRYSKDKFHLNKRKFMEFYYRIVPVFAVRRADAVISVSNASKQAILEYMKIPHERIFVTYEAPAKVFRPIENDAMKSIVREKYGLNSNIILGMGSADRRKNVIALIRAYALLPVSLRKQYQLVIVWNHKLLESESFVEAKQQGIFKQVLFLENVKDEDLALVYNLATLFVFPSLEEGFGLPPLEAMACGVAVLAANNSSIPEVVGDAALLFDANNVSGLAELITKVLTDSVQRKDMERRAIQRASDFSWKKCALETINVYKKAKITYGQRMSRL